MAKGFSITTHPPFRKNGADEAFNAAYRALVLEAYRRITMKTPRDTGRAAGNWQITFNLDQPTDKSLKLPVKGSIDSGELHKVTPQAFKPIPDVVISNPLPYILRLEYGWSAQARSPDGMVRTTLAELGAMT